MKGTNEKDTSEVVVPYPPNIAEQRAIAHILGTVDDKIDGRWQRGQSLPGLPTHLYDLFPDRLVDSELGEFPEEWEIASTSQLIEFNPTESLRKDTDAPYNEMDALPTSGCWPEPPVARPFGCGMRFRSGDTLLARITPCLENGKTAFIQCLPDTTVGWGNAVEETLAKDLQAEFRGRNMNRPLGIATYTVSPQLPASYESELPSPEQIAVRLQAWANEQGEGNLWELGYGE